jgi:UDPglucose 6-dehydrogenase
MSSRLTNLSVFGLGKLGACIAATFASRGCSVLGVDVDQEKIDRLNAGEPPVAEPLLAETIAAGKDNLRATLDVSAAVETQTSFFIPPSPSLPDGSFSTEFLLKAMQPLAAALRKADKRGHLFVCSSTTTPTACDRVLIPMIEKETAWKCGEGFHFCYNPEFIALGDVIKGLLQPDIVLIGESDAASGDRLEELYRRYCTNTPHIARMSVISAELTKISVNSYITMKISFTNQLRMIAERLPGADIHAILDAIGSDSRIGKKYLCAGTSYGGPCFPRDNRLVAYTANQLGLTAPLAEATDRINDAAKAELVNQVKTRLSPGGTILVLGVAYKPKTYITEESAGLFVAQHLKRSGYRVLVHDFESTPANSPALHEFEVLSDPAALPHDVHGAVAVLCCPSPEYKSIHFPEEIEVISPWEVR